MAHQFTTVSSKGQLVIPAEVRTALNIHPGTRLAIMQDGDRIVLQPVDSKLVRDTLGMTAGSTSMADGLLKERRLEDRKSR